MTSNPGGLVESAIAQILSVRNGVQQLFDGLSQPVAGDNKQQLAATVQGIASNVAAFAASWEGSLAPIIQTLDGSIDAAPGLKQEPVAGGLKLEPMSTGGGPAVSDSSAQTSKCKRVAQELDAALCEELALPTLWEASIRSKRARAGPPEAAAPSATPSSAQELSGVLERVRAACPGMSVQGVNLMGSMSKVAMEDVVEVRLVYPNVLCASVVLEGPGRVVPVRVVVDAAEHVGELDPWAPTANHQVFRRVSALAMRALAFFMRRAHAVVTMHLGALPSAGAGVQLAAVGMEGAVPGAGAGAVSPGGVALEDLLLWLASYRDLFSRPCAISGKVLALEPASMHPLPPVFRPFMVSREVLLERASCAEKLVAYHMHMAPQELLGCVDSSPPLLVQAQLNAA